MINEQTLVEHVKRYRNKIVRAIEGNVWGLFLDKPLGDFTTKEEGFEQGLQAAIAEIQKFIIEPEDSHPSPAEQGGPK